MFFPRLAGIVLLLAAGFPVFSAELGVPVAPGKAAPEIGGFDLDALRNEIPADKRVHLDYFEKVTVDAYRKIGSHNPRWDADAELALSLYAVSMTDSHSVWGRPAMPVLLAALRRLVIVGCDDPLVKHAIFRTDELCLKVGLPYDERATYYRSIVASFDKHPYPASRRCFMRLAGARALKYSSLPMKESYPEANEMLIAGIKELPEAIKEKDIPEAEFYDLASGLFYELFKENDEKEKLFEEIYPGLEAGAGKDSVIPLIAKGRFYCNLAFGPKAPDDAAGLARRAFQEAWARNQTDRFISAGMMDFSQSGDEREEWFQRCKKIDSHFAYGCKLNYALPEWGGSLEQLINLGRQAYEEGDWEHDTPLTLIGAHDLYVKRCTYDYGTVYYSRPEVWADFKMVYEEYLKRHPNDNENRTAYLYHAYLCKKWEEAKALLDELGDMAVPVAFGRHFEFNGARYQIEQHAKALAH